MAVFGIDLGATKIAGALFSNDGEILKRTVSQVEGRTGSGVGGLICSVAGELIESARETTGGLGICVPGIAGSSGKIWAPNIPGWDDYPLMQELREHFPSTVIRIESDRTCYILGEAWKGAAKGCRNAIYVSVGTGIGAGILSDGRVIHGSGDIAGSAGWMALEPPYSREYDSCGCFEYHASGRGIVEKAMKLVDSLPHYEGLLRKGEALTAGDVVEAFRKGDQIGTQIMQKAITMWGMAAANLVSLFDPEMIIFGGGVFGPASELIGDITVEAAKWAQPVSMSRVKFGHSSLGGDAGLFGAGYLAIDVNS